MILEKTVDPAATSGRIEAEFRRIGCRDASGFSSADQKELIILSCPQYPEAEILLLLEKGIVSLSYRGSAQMATLRSERTCDVEKLFLRVAESADARIADHFHIRAEPCARG